MLASGAHVKIGSIEYVLAEDEEPHYHHRFESLFSPTSAIAGEIAKDQIRPEKLLWSMTDWAGGEGGRIFYPQTADRYDFGTLINATVRGQLTTRPRRYRSAVARSGSNADTGSRPAGVSANRHALIAWEDNIISSPNGIAWTAAQDTSPAGSTANWADAISDGVNVGVLPADWGVSDAIPVIQADSSVATWTDTHAGSTNPAAPMVGAVVDGVPYVFALSTGAGSGVLELYKKAAVMDTAADWVGSTIYSTNIVPSGTWGTDYWTSMTGAETGMFISFSTKTHSFVWEIRNDIGRPFYTAPPGFTVKKLIYKANTLFLLGNQTAAGRQFASIIAIPLSTRTPLEPLKEPRKHLNTELSDFSIGCAGPGPFLFCADAHSGKIFVYDIENDAIHLFDDLANGGTGDGMSFTSGANLLTPNQASIETDTTGWTANDANTTISRSTSFAYHGAASLSVDPTAAGTASAITTTGVSGVNVAASTAYTARAYMRMSAGDAWTGARVKIVWYDISGSTISTSTGTDIVPTTSFQLVSVSATSPSTAVFAAVILEATASAGTDEGYWDAISLHAGSATADTDQIAFLAMHGVRLYGATWQPLGAGTSLQVFSYDDLEPDNRDMSQAISASWTSAEWDFGLPMEIKGLIGFYVTFKVTDSGTTSGLVANSRITVSYSTDDSSYTALTTITSATTPTGAKGRVFIQVSDGSSTVKFSRLKVRVALDNNSTSSVAPPVLYGITAEAQPLAYAETWDLMVRVEDEDSNERPSLRQNDAATQRDNLEDLAQNKSVVTFLDGYRYPQPNSYTTHTVVVEDPQDEIRTLAEGVMRVKLRAIV